MKLSPKRKGFREGSAEKSGYLGSRIFLIGLCVSLVLVILPTVLSSMGLGHVVRDAVHTVAYPLEWCFTKVYDGLDGFRAYFTEYDRLKEENEALREALREYEAMEAENEVYRSENRWLRDYLSLKNEHIDYALLDAAIVARSSTSFTTVLTLNRGSAHGVKEGMPVVTSNGVFGYVKEVSLLSCKVVSIVETAVSVGAFVSRTGATGMIEGDFSLRDSGRVVMKGIDASSEIVEGDLVYTSGTGSVYPRGLLIGKVTSLENDPYSRTVTAIVEPSEDFLSIGSMSHLMIVTDYQVYVDEESGEAPENGD